MTRRFGPGALAAGMVLATPSLAEVTLSDPGHDGMVVEAGTDRPIAGVKVIGRWVVAYSSVARSGERCVKVLVVESDATGRFQFPSWTRKDTPVTSMDLMVSGYKPGYRFAEASQPIIAQPGALGRLAGGGDVKLAASPVRVAMTSWDPSPAERAKYLLEFLPTTECSYTKAEWGTLYHVRKSVYDEFAAFPPEVQRSGKMDYMAWLTRQVEASRRKLASESSGSKEKSP